MPGIQKTLDGIATSDVIYRDSIQQEANCYVAAQVLKLMEKIPVEEVNRDKRGIRVKALRDSGYVTYADMLTSSIYQLAAIRGISEDGARIIKRIVSEAADKASTTTKLRLSADNRTEDMTRLITAVSQYQQAKPLAEESNRLSQQYSNTIQNALEDIKVSTGTFRWLFASRQTKQNAIESYKLLEETLHGEYGQTAERLQSGSVAIEALAEDDAWDSFKKHPSHMPILLKKSFRDCRQWRYRVWASGKPCQRSSGRVLLSRRIAVRFASIPGMGREIHTASKESPSWRRNGLGQDDSGNRHHGFVKEYRGNAFHCHMSGERHRQLVPRDAKNSANCGS